MKCSQCNTEISDDSRFCKKCGNEVRHGEGGESFVQTKTITTTIKDVTPGSLFAEKYRIIEEIGRGGMGVVYKAEDLKLKRTVALKFLPPEMTRHPEAKERFIREAQAAAALDHPNICTVYEVEEADDKTYIAMAYIEGHSLRERIKRPLDIEQALDIAMQITEGMQEAHRKGIVHRDIKSANVMLDARGQTKIMDFGLAKVSGDTLMTREGTAMGTVAYMSPEQTRGEPVDFRTDIWSLGVVLYEMLSGQLPFMAEHETSVMYAIVHEEPIPVGKFNPDVPFEMVEIINRSLQKKPDSRYQSAAEMLKALKEYQDILKAPEYGIKDFKSFLRVVRKPKVAIPAIVIILAFAAAAFLYFNRQSKIRWATNQALPQIISFIGEENNFEAFQLARQAEKYIPNSPMLKEHLAKISIEISINTIPPGADVYIKDYKVPHSEWEYLGQTPIEQVRLPYSLLRWKFEKQGFVTVEWGFRPVPEIEEKLFEIQNAPPGMIWLPEQEYSIFQAFYIGLLERLEIGECWIDRFEVTNKQFKEFLDSGGYEKQEHWKIPFKKEGRVLPWIEAMKDFVDKTGQPGPSTWELGNYPKGQDDHPVTGVSWYEAAAYAEYAGKSLPTFWHWTTAARLIDVTDIVPFSNFSGKGTAPVGSYQGISPWGAYDMGGNVKEWCWNETGDMRYIMGGGWDDPPYMFFAPYAKSPYDRADSNGFRCALEVSEGDKFARLREPILPHFRDYSKEKPVSDEIFRVYKDIYVYEKTELAPKVESIDESSVHWIKEKITFNATYENDRMIAYLYLPKKGKPPFQTVVWYPGGGAFYIRSSEKIDEDMRYIDFLLIQGRAVLYPIYKSTYERHDNFDLHPPNINRNSWRDHCIKWSQDLGLAIDYLETREDIDKDKLAYHGFSQGAIVAPILLALESRIKAGILEAGGILTGGVANMVSPDADPFHFAPRVKIPILMLNGEYDILRRVEESQEQLKRFLGSPEEHKHYKVYKTSHHAPRLERIKEVTAFLDRYLGKVK